MTKRRSPGRTRETVQEALVFGARRQEVTLGEVGLRKEEPGVRHEGGGAEADEKAVEGPDRVVPVLLFVLLAAEDVQLLRLHALVGIGGATPAQEGEGHEDEDREPPCVGGHP